MNMMSKTPQKPMQKDAKAPKIQIRKSMRLGSMFSEILPLMMLFIGNSLYNIFVGAAASVLCTVIVLTIIWQKEHRVARFALFSVILSFCFTCAAIIFGESTFIKIQPTLFNGVFSFVLLGGWLRDQAMMKQFFGAQFILTEDVWKILSLRWGIFFFVLAVSNEWAWRSLSDDGWVWFKTFIAAPATGLFMLAQLPITIRGTKAAKAEANR